MAAFKVGVQLYPQHTSVDDLRAAWQAADRLGVDSIWLWDHFFPIEGDPEGAHLEGWSLLAAMAVDTERAQIGVLVSCSRYRNPDLLADMARTIDHLSGGRVVLGLGAGWSERDHQEYGYELGTPADRVRALEDAVARIQRRMTRLKPPPMGELPLLIGGGGEKVTLRLAAQHARMWNVPGPPPRFAAKTRMLDEWCGRVGRDPSEIERSVTMPGPGAIAKLDEYLEAGAQHIVLGRPHPFDLGPVARLLELARS